MILSKRERANSVDVFLKDGSFSEQSINSSVDSFAKDEETIIASEKSEGDRSFEKLLKRVEEGDAEAQNELFSYRGIRTRKRILWYSAIIILLFVVGAIFFWPFKSKPTNSSKIEIISESEKTCRIVAEIQYDNQGRTSILPYVSTELTGSYSIPEKIDGYTVTEIGDYAFRYTQIRQITIPRTVTSIGNRAFANSKLHEIKLEKNIEKIGNNAFYMCKNTRPNKVGLFNLMQD